MAKNLFRPVLAKAALYPFKGIVLLAGILLVYSCDFPGSLPDRAGGASPQRADGPSPQGAGPSPQGAGASSPQGAGGPSSQGAGGASPQALGSGEGNLTVNFSGGGNTRSGGRSVLSDNFIGSLEYKVKFTSPGGTVIERTATGGSITVTLNAGLWHIAAQAYGLPGVVGGPLVGSETVPVSVTVAPGQNQGVTIEMSVNPTYEAGLTDIYIHNEAELRRVGVDFAIDNTIRFYLERDIVLTQPWTPIGDAATPFKAEFDGGGYRITMGGGFHDDALDDDDLGLFGYADGAVIKDLTIELAMGSADSPVQLSTPNSEDSHYIGGLAGRLDNYSMVENVTVSGFLYVKQNGNNQRFYVGGITGMVRGDSKIKECSVAMEIHGDSDKYTFTGGVAGANGVAGNTLGPSGVAITPSTGTISESSFSGTVNSVGSGPPASDFIGIAGGIAGSNFNGIIRECHAAGTIKGTRRAGGIAGEMQEGGGSGTSIVESSFTGTVRAENTGVDAFAGGVVGQSNWGVIERSYAAGNVIAQGSDAYAGGIAGMFSDTNIRVSDCYAYANVLSNGSTGTGYVGGIGGRASYIERCYAAGTVEAQGSGGTAVYAGGISGQVVTSYTLKNCKVLLDALDGGSSNNVYTLFGGVTSGSGSASGNNVWDIIAIKQGGTTYNSGSYAPAFTKDIASFDTAADFGQGNETTTYTGWNFTGNWKFITGAGYDFPVLEWQTAPPDLSLVFPH
ncbi:MAG: hypothetical protein LBD37_01430 [Treponema sp.]|nr:hypothetical protein [Treponema sp.]